MTSILLRENPGKEMCVQTACLRIEPVTPVCDYIEGELLYLGLEEEVNYHCSSFLVGYVKHEACAVCCIYFTTALPPPHYLQHTH